MLRSLKIERSCTTVSTPIASREAVNSQAPQGALKRTRDRKVVVKQATTLTKRVEAFATTTAPREEKEAY